MATNWGWKACPCNFCAKRDNSSQMCGPFGVCIQWKNWFTTSWSKTCELLKDYIKEVDENG